MIKEKIKQWFMKNHPNAIASNGLEYPDSHQLVDLTAECFNDLQGWVSAKDRIPYDGQEVLMWMGSGAIFSDIKCHSGRYSIKYGFERSRVTHWRPMPLPPSEGWV